MDTRSKSARLKRLSRIEGQVRGLGRMVEEDRYCIEVITQIAAVRAALARVEEEILREHMHHCVRYALTGSNKGDQEQKIEELITVLSRSRA